MKRNNTPRLPCNFWKQSFPMLAFINLSCSRILSNKKAYSSNNELNIFPLHFSVPFFFPVPIQKWHKMTILPFHLSCDKGLFTQSRLTAGQENSESNLTASARTGIPVEPDRCLPALARAERKIVCLPWWNAHQDTIHQIFSGSMNIFIDQWPMNEWGFSPTWQFFPFWGQNQFSELLMDKHIFFSACIP